MSEKPEKSSNASNAPDADADGKTTPHSNASGGALAWMLVAALLALCLALLSKILTDAANHENTGKSAAPGNPLFQKQENAESADNDRPAGALMATTDAEKIEKERPLHQSEFEKALKNAPPDTAEEMKKREAMAAERLELLKRMENAKSNDERAEIIRETLEKHKTGKNLTPLRHDR